MGFPYYGPILLNIHIGYSHLQINVVKCLMDSRLLNLQQS